MTLANRINRFISELGIPKTVFCRHISLSPQGLNAWLRGEINFKEETEQRIDTYLKKYGF